MLKINDAHILKKHETYDENNLLLPSRDAKASSERSVNAKLLHYFSNLVGQKFDLDVEYNLDLNKPGGHKALSNLRERSGNNKVYPDLIVHKRGTDLNHLVVEIKKGTASTEFDYIKLKAYTLEMNYHLGILLVYESTLTSATFSFEYFQNGDILNAGSMFEEIKAIEQSFFPTPPSNPA